MPRHAKLLVSLIVTSIVAAAGCVGTGTHEAVLAELDKAKKEMASTSQTLTGERDEAIAKSEKCDGNLTLALDQNQQLVAKVSSMGQDVEQLLGERGELTNERERLTAEQKELAKEVVELRRLRSAAEARNKEFKTLLSKLHGMISAGKLQVKMRNGTMLVQMSSDVVFPPGGTRIKTEGREALVELAHTLAQFKDRKFQVVGHSDATPIRTARFPSNWELSSQRAIEVVKLLIESGVPPEIINAAGNAEFDPIADNDTPENKELNRRVEVIFVPKIAELPGFESALGGG